MVISFDRRYVEEYIFKKKLKVGVYIICRTQNVVIRTTTFVD